jgi:hypothetical protein
VRIQARKVRSFARVNRGSGSLPASNTLAGNRSPVLIRRQFDDRSCSPSSPGYWTTARRCDDGRRRRRGRSYRGAPTRLEVLDRADGGDGSREPDVGEAVH